jgi:transcriptional regulator with XRE-family HTH domain
MDIAKKIQTLRIERDLTLAEVASGIGMAGPSAICNWEKSLNKPNARSIYKLSRFFQVPIDFFYQEDETKKPRSAATLGANNQNR